MSQLPLEGLPAPDALFELTPAVTKTLTQGGRKIHTKDICLPPLPDGVIRLDLPRWDQDWEIKTRRGGWPKIDPQTGKVIKHRRVWDILKGNARYQHYAQRHLAVKQVIQDVSAAATKAGLRPCEHLTVQLVWAPGDNRRADDDNLWNLQKVCCDGLARGRKDLPGLQLVPDDTRQWMEKLAPRIDRPPVPAGLWLEVLCHREPPTPHPDTRLTR